MSSWERQRYGVTVSALVSGKVYSAVGWGPFRPALEDALASLERRGTVEKVLAISTPETIYRDLKTDGEGPRQQPPEPQFLGMAGRMDLAPIPGKRKFLPPWKPPAPRKRVEVRVWPLRCRGKTQRGERCKLYALPGRRLCRYHRSKR